MAAPSLRTFGGAWALLGLLTLEACLPQAPAAPEEPPPPPPLARRLSAGLRDTCVVSDSGEVYCWGANCHGAPHDGYFEFVCSWPRRVPSLSDVKAFAPMQSFLGLDCALKQDGSVWCAESQAPYHRVLASGAQNIYHAETFVCALLNDGRVSCWGTFTQGAAQPTLEGAKAPTILQGPHDVVSLSASTGRACALSNAGEAWCWTRAQPTSEPVARLERPPLRLVGLGLSHNYINLGWSQFPWDIDLPRGVSEGGNTCFLLQSGELHCSGSAQHREDAGDFGDTSLSFSALAVGLEHTCAIEGGAAQCWGANGAAQLGRAGKRSAAPSTVRTNEPLVEIVAGYNHTCARSASGAVWCWGANSDGELGIGSRTPYEIGARRLSAFGSAPASSSSR